jgi:hypothetical protein
MVAMLTFVPELLSSRRGLFLVGLLFAVSVAPLLSVEIPAMIDYVNHLARMHLLVDAAAGPAEPRLSNRLAALPESCRRHHCARVGAVCQCRNCGSGFSACKPNVGG